MVGGDDRGVSAAQSEPVGRRDELIRAACERVAEVGFEGLRLRQVADDVGIDHSTLHHHIATRQDLITGVAEYVTGQLRLTMPDDPDPARALRGHLAALREAFDQSPELVTVTVELDLRARRDPAVRALVQRYEAGWRQALGELLARGVRTGTWSQDTQPQATVELIIAVVKGTRLASPVVSEVFDQLDALLTNAGDSPSGAS